MAGGAELVVVSNRGPYSMQEGADGSFRAVRGGGGLAPSLAAALEARGQGGVAEDDAPTNPVWVAAARSAGDRRVAQTAQPTGNGVGLSVHFVDLDDDTARAAYDVVANSTLWFLFHGLFDASRRPVFDRVWYEAWEAFRRYNVAFAEMAAEAAAPSATVLVNDYHLLLAGARLRSLRPDLRSVHFSHTPFSAPGELEMLPAAVRREILTSMASFGACGFHTARWEDAFRRSAESDLGTAPPTFHAGLGADVDRLAATSSSPGVSERLARLEELLGGRRLILRSDRVELSKNLLRGFRAFEAMLEENPGWRDRVVMLARAYSSRESLPEYLAYRAEVEHAARLVNERFGTGSWRPVVMEVEDDFASTVAAFRRYDVLLVNPVRDGMNLVAKEGPSLNERGGVLVLSELAGAYEELQDDVLGVNPFDVRATSQALLSALEMPEAERRRRAAALAAKAALRGPAGWLEVVLDKAVCPRAVPG